MIMLRCPLLAYLQVYKVANEDNYEHENKQHFYSHIKGIGIIEIRVSK